MTTRRWIRAVVAAAPWVAAVACGDLPKDLIVGGAAGSAGTESCTSAADCTAEAPLCSPATGLCVECLRATDCDGGVCSGAGTCSARCEDVEDCTPSRPVCEFDTGLCRGCVNDAECTGTSGLCDAASGSCVECRESTDCTNGDFPICDTSNGRCVECLEDRNCNDPSERCSFALGACAERCADGCPVDNPFCDETIGGFCVECLTDADCGAPGEIYCRRSECVK